MKGDNNLTECSGLIQPDQGKIASTAQRPRKQEDIVAGNLQEGVSHLANPQQSEHLGRNLTKLLKTAPRLEWSTKVLNVLASLHPVQTTSSPVFFTREPLEQALVCWFYGLTG